MFIRGILRKIAAVALLAGAASAVSAAPMPHLFQVGVDAIPIQQYMSVYKDNTAWYSGWGSGLEGALRYLSPVGLTVGVRGGYQTTPYNGSDMRHYPVLATLGYRFQAGTLGISIEGLAGYEFIHYDGAHTGSILAGGRLYLEMHIGVTGLSLSVGGEALWASKTPVAGNAELSHRISVPVTVGLTYSVPIGGAKTESVKAGPEKPALIPPSSTVIGNINIFENNAPGALIFEWPSAADETAAEPVTEPAPVEETPAEVAVAEESVKALPDYVEAFFSVPEGETVPADVLEAFRGNKDGFRYSWSVRRIGDDADAPVRDAWVSATDPETGAELRRAVTPEEAAVLAGVEG